MSLVLATLIWLLIRKHLIDQKEWIEARGSSEPPKARVVTPEELRQQQEEQLAAAISMMVRDYLREQEQLKETALPDPVPEPAPPPEGSAPKPAEGEEESP